MAFRTIAGIICAEIKGERVKVRLTPPQRVELGVTLQAEEDTLSLDFINTGVPHVVHFVADQSSLETIDVFRLGRILRYHPQFQPSGTNANFAAVHDPHHIAVRTYERGVEAETLACGTGSIAAVLLAAARKLVVSPVEVLTQSQEILTIYFEERTDKGLSDFTEVYLEGDAKVVYEANLWDETLRK
jgi:diaminopimelate epimerase